MGFTSIKHLYLAGLIVLSCGTVNSLWGQAPCNAVLSGKAVDEHNGEPLQYAQIRLEGTAKGAITDTSGAYRIEGICAGTYQVICSHIGCDTLEVRIKVKGVTTYNFFPEHHEDLLETVNIVGHTHTADEVASQSESELSEQEMDQGKGQSLGQMLSKLSGVTTLSTGNSIAKPVIHGLHSNRIVILNNGVRQEGQQWGSEHAPEIDPFIADQLTVVKGASSVIYGPDAIAGVILVNPRRLRDSAGVGGELSLVGFSNGRQGAASGMLEGNFGKIPALSWRMQGSLKSGGNVQAPNYFLANTGVREYNFSLATGYLAKKAGLEFFYSQFNTNLGVFSGAHIGNLTDLQAAFEATEPLVKADFSYDIGRPFQHIEHELFKAGAYWRTGLVGKLRLTYARQYNLRYEYDKDPPLNDSLAALNLPEFKFRITTHTTGLAWEHYRRKGFKGTAGISTLQQANTWEGRFFIPSFRKFVGGAYLAEHWRPDSSRIELEAGARFDYAWQQVYHWEGGQLLSPEYRYQNLSWNLGAVYSLLDSLKIRANLGSAWRPPGVNELFSDGLHHGAAAVEIGDRNLMQERSLNLSLGGEYRGGNLQVAVDGYRHVFSNFIYLVPVLPPTLTIRGAFPTFHYRQVPAVLTGADLTVRWRFLPVLTLTSRATVLRAQNRDTGENLVQMPADRFDNSLELKLPEAKFFRDGYLSVSVLSVLKQWRVKPEIDFVRPPGGYTLLGAQAGFHLPAGGQLIRVGLGVSNLLNVSYRDYMNRFRYYTDDMGRNFTFRLTIPFNVFSTKASKSNL